MPRPALTVEICIAGIPRHAGSARYSGRGADVPIAPAGSRRSCRSRKSQGDAAATAKLLVVLLAFAWGLNWIAAAYALREVRPWSLRVAGSAIGAATLFGAADLYRPQHEGAARRIYPRLGRRLLQCRRIPDPFRLCAVERGDLARIIITYSMPIWTTVLSRFVLGERLNAIGWFAFALCVLA